MAYSMIPVITSTIPNNSTTTISNWYGFSQSFLQEIVDALGDGFYVENATLINATVYHWGNNNDVTINGVVPFIKNTSWGNIGFAFQCNPSTNAVSQNNIYGMIFDFDTNSYVYNIPFYRTVETFYWTTNLAIINAGPSLKMIQSNSTYGVYGAIVFKDNLIISPVGKRVDDTYWTCQIYNCANKRTIENYSPVVRGYNHNYMQLTPVTYVSGQEVIILDDVFNMLVATDDLGNAVNRSSSGEITYSCNGRNQCGNSRNTFYHPIFVISNMYSPPDYE